MPKSIYLKGGIREVLFDDSLMRPLEMEGKGSWAIQAHQLTGPPFLHID